jgi:hypothetical protein
LAGITTLQVLYEARTVAHRVTSQGNKGPLPVTQPPCCAVCRQGDTCDVLSIRWRVAPPSHAHVHSRAMHAHTVEEIHVTGSVKMRP